MYATNTAQVYLFNDLLLAVKVEGSGKNEKYLVRGWFPLESIKVVNHADTDGTAHEWCALVALTSLPFQHTRIYSASSAGRTCWCSSATATRRRASG